MENKEKSLKTENKGRGRELLGCLLLFITALIWGLAFVAQSKGMESVGPFTFHSIRSFIGAIALIPVLVFNRKKILIVNDFEGRPIEDARKKRQLLITGLVSVSIIFFLASTAQQIGIGKTDSVGKAGFITALYIVLVPLAGIFLKKPPRWIVFLCVAASAFGLYLLCIKKGEGFKVNSGDILLIVCAVLFAVHIILIDYFAGKINGVLIAFTQFLTVGVLCGIGMVFFEKPDLGAIKDAALPLLYAGALSSGVGYTLQILGQRYVEPTKASLIMCLESVFSVLGGWVILHQQLTLREGIGCIIMFIAILVCQIFGNKPAPVLREGEE
ncbi:MAG: DMT family transporter [Lachnospiraceae bacterium]|nr:DMT family transporter [Lachnospiraceae bacterium]